MDPCLELVYGSRARKPWTLRQTLVALPLRRMFLHADTPQDRIERAVHRELADLSSRADRAVAALAVDAPASRAACEALQRARDEGAFPRQKLERIALTLELSAPASIERLQRELERWIDAHKRFERRLRWLLNPEVTRAQLATLDPVEDADQIWCFVKYEFRPEFLWCAWGNAIERIVQLETTSLFFHATGKAESIPVKRTEDTLIHYYYFVNWGLDSYHGRTAIEAMNRIHGRFFIHNDGMKYVLLNAAFTVIDSLQRIGHRPLADVERLGYFHAQITMGQAMRIQGLTHSWDEMRGWFDTVNRAHASYAPLKRRMWASIEDNFDRGAGVPGPVSRFRKLMEVIAMDDTYRAAIGAELPPPATVARVKRVVNAVVRARAMLPRGEPYIESLQNFISYPNGVDIEHAGERKRSENLPAACPFSAAALARGVVRSHDEPEMAPLMHASEAPEVNLPSIGWDEIRRHCTADDLWVVFGGHVYDVSAFARSHPGGLPILLSGVGRDMTEAFEEAGHSDLTKIFALNFRIGKVAATVTAPARHHAVPVEVQVS